MLASHESTSNRFASNGFRSNIAADISQISDQDNVLKKFPDGSSNIKIPLDRLNKNYIHILEKDLEKKATETFWSS